MTRRDFLAAASASAAVLATGRASGQSATPALLKPRRLQPGDIVGVVTPATATFQQVELDIVRESLEALGLKVRVGEHVMNRYGSLGGADKDRAAGHQQVLRRSRRARGASDARRLGQRAAAAASRLRRHPAESENHPRLQRHHGAAERHSRAHGSRHVSRPEWRRPLGQLLARLDQAGAVRRRGRDVQRIRRRPTIGTC